MKRIIITALSTFLVFTAVLFNACKHDPCKEVSCAFGGTCKDGNCLCQVGYEGEHCETITRAKFEGIWNVNEDGTLSSPAQFTASIENGPSINQVAIKNLQNTFTETIIGIAYKDTLTIPLQTLSDGRKVEGWATIVDTNPLNQHYYQHAVMTVYYKVTSSDGLQVNEYGSGGAGASLWAK